ncbi:MAG: tetratricopeptide repeat protein, partial [Acetobacteraceae bacterium]|nr:tetratricopeptide repeat protein [Acetobacteraceae bacterium]
QPGDAQVFGDLARVRLALGDTEEALQLLSRALELDSGDRVLLLLEMAETLRQRGDLAGAEAALRQALSLEPGNARVQCALASGLEEKGELDEAEAIFTSVLAEAPDDIGAWNGLGAIYMSRGDPTGALQFFNRVHSIEPCNTEALYGVGAALMALNRPEEAADWLRRATAAGYGRRSEMAEGLAQLTLGDLPAGFRCFEARLDLADVTPLGASHRGLRRWRGEDLAGRTILLVGEQGLGDTVQFCRYAPIVAKLGARVVVQASVPVVTLLETLDRVAEVVHAGGALPDVDYYCPLMSLPLEFGTTLETIPKDVPYLAPTADRIAHMRGRVGNAPRPRVGIAWSGNPKYANDRKRSVPVALLEPLCAAAGSLHVLQKDVPDADRAVLNSWANVYDHSETIVDLAGTAAMASLMDVIVSVDTSVAHVAGAIAHPVWLMLPFAPDWRWLLKREDSLWYPTARLFRQRALGDWEDVVERVALALRSLPARPRR